MNPNDTRGWSREFAFSFAHSLTERRFSKLSITVDTLTIPDSSFEADFRMREDLPLMPDQTIDESEISLSVDTRISTETSTDPREYDIPEERGTYFVELTFINLSIPEWNYRAATPVSSTIGRFVCPAYDPDGDTCHYPELIDDHL